MVDHVPKRLGGSVASMDKSTIVIECVDSLQTKAGAEETLWYTYMHTGKRWSTREQHLPKRQPAGDAMPGCFDPEQESSCTESPQKMTRSLCWFRPRFRPYFGRCTQLRASPAPPPTSPSRVIVDRFCPQKVSSVGRRRVCTRATVEKRAFVHRIAYVLSEYLVRYRNARPSP